MSQEPSIEVRLKALEAISHMHAIALNSMLKGLQEKGDKDKNPYFDLINSAADDYEQQGKPELAQALKNVLTTIK